MSELNQAHFSQRRQVTQLMAATAVLGGFGVPSAQAQNATKAATPVAQAAPSQDMALTEGKDYRKLERPVPGTAKGKVEVMEFFGYWCPHCNVFEPELNAWIAKLPKDVSFTRIPVFFGAQTEPFQKLYYTLESMNLLSSMHAKVFAALHVDKKKLQTDSDILDWVASQSVDKTKFSETYNSFGIQSKAKRAGQLTTACEIEAIPSMVVAGQYVVSNSANILKIVNTLINRSRATK